MRKLLYIGVLFLFTVFSACNDFMEFPPAAEFNRDSVFAKYTNVERLVYDMYSYPVPLNFDTRSFGTDGTRLNGGSFASALTDEGQAFDVQSGYQVQMYYTGNVDAGYSASWKGDYHGEDDYLAKWTTIRKAYILLENIDRVPDATEEQKMRIKGEAKLMIATVYFEMFKRYGGVPIITKSFTGSESEEEINLGRSSLEETYKFIIGLLDEVLTDYKDYIPANYTDIPAEFGRFPLAFAYALKARVKLYAASPLYNTATPYSRALGEKSNLICFMSENRELWKEAADAATEAINFCMQNGYGLVDDPTGREDGMNYTCANIEYPSKGNTEVIWGVIMDKGPQAGGAYNMQNYTIIRGLPNVGVYSWGYAANLVPLNQVERYEIDDDNTPGQYLSWEGVRSYETGIISDGESENAKKMLAEAARRPYEEVRLDPRFYASVAYNGVADYGIWGEQNEIDMADAYADPVDGGEPKALSGKHGNSSEGKQKVKVLHYVRKFTRGYEGREASLFPLNIYMRMAELYLIRAEALNEYAGPSQQVYDDLNLIRTRSGMCNVKQTTDQKEMREIIAHERNIEMFYEDQRWFDLRRTLQSEDDIPVTIYKLQIRKWYKTEKDNWPYKITYEKVPYMDRWWDNKMYMNPFPQNEINKFYGLIQNPGW